MHALRRACTARWRGARAWSVARAWRRCAVACPRALARCGVAKRASVRWVGICIKAYLRCSANVAIGKKRQPANRQPAGDRCVANLLRIVYNQPERGWREVRFPANLRDFRPLFRPRFMPSCWFACRSRWLRARLARKTRCFGRTSSLRTQGAPG